MIEKQPENITLCTVEAVLMPNGEVICLGKTIGFYKTLKEYLTVKVETGRLIAEKEQIRRGDLLAGILKVPYIRKEARYKTEWGTKTALGLYLTAKRIIEEGK